LPEIKHKGSPYKAYLGSKEKRKYPKVIMKDPGADVVNIRKVNPPPAKRQKPKPER
jgi:hypothetical protein